MQEFIARENIKRFEAQLADCTDEDQRQVILRLLGDEQRRLAEILVPQSVGRGPPPKPTPLSE